MKAAGVAIAALVLVGGGMVGLWFFLSGPSPVAEEELASEPAAEPGEMESDVELEDPEEALAWAETGSEVLARAEIAPAPEEVAEASASPVPAAPLRGILRDAATHEPLPLYLLAIDQEGERRADVTTDDQGRFATSEAIEAGRILVHPLDHPRRRTSTAPIALRHEVKDGSAPDLELALASGPTYRLSLSPSGSPAAADFEAQLRVASVEERSSTPPEPVRDGHPPWVRFPPIQAGFDRAESIELRSRDGLWRGDAAVSAARGIVPGVVEVVLEARAVLAGRVTDGEGSPIRGASVVLDGTTLAGKGLQRSAASDRDGRYRFDFLREGSGVVSVRSLRHAAQESPVRLIAKEVATLDFSLVALPPAGSIAGIIRSETGTYAESVRVALNPPRDANAAGKGFPPLTVEASFETVDGRKVGKFEFPALPAGRYELRVQASGWLEWEPRSLLVSPPAENAVFLVHDDLSLADFAVRARDADNGAPFAWFHATTYVANGPTRSSGTRADTPVLQRFPLGRSFRWRVDREGYRPAFGDEDDFSVQEIRDGKVVRIADVGLRPGWGDVFRVVQRGNGKPIEGARILVDGREVATTKADGTARVAAARKPEKVGVAWKDWRVAGAIDLRPIWRRDDKVAIVVRMAPPPPKKKS